MNTLVPKVPEVTMKNICGVKAFQNILYLNFHREHWYYTLCMLYIMVSVHPRHAL